jgi:threonine/homoserine/homoserine lactone efflux protein
MSLLVLALVFIVGFIIMTPIGPVSTICIRQSLLYGRRAGILAGAGDAAAVAIYASMGVAGSTLLTHFFAPYTSILHVAVTIILLAAAIIIWKSKPILPELSVPKTTHLVSGFLAALLMALANPADIVLFAALFAGLGVIIHSPIEHSLFFITMFAGGSIYWIVVSLLIHNWRLNFKSSHIIWFNRACSLMLSLGAFASLGTLIKGL